MRAKALWLLGFVFISEPSHAQSEVLLQAISFAVTGSDATKVATVDRTQCIFRVNSETFYFNNMYTDRIRFQNLQNKLGQFWTIVEMHGKQKVVESSPAKIPDNLGTMSKDLKNYYKESYDASATVYPDYFLRVDTRESERLAKAWQYIFANGCKGLTSPF